MRKPQEQRLILASSSPRRRELLQHLGIPFEVVVAHTEEGAVERTPERLVESLARFKAEATASILPHDTGEPGFVVIAADTVVVLGSEVLGKPGSAAAAKSMLRQLSGSHHRVLTGVAALPHPAASGGGKSDGPVGTVRVGHVETTVTFRPLSDEEIDRYVSTGEPLDKAGAYGIQGRGRRLVEAIEGDYFNVVGLPLEFTRQLMLPFFPEAKAAPPPALPRIRRLAGDPDPSGRALKPGDQR